MSHLQLQCFKLSLGQVPNYKVVSRQRGGFMKQIQAREAILCLSQTSTGSLVRRPFPTRIAEVLQRRNFSYRFSPIILVKDPLQISRASCTLLKEKVSQENLVFYRRRVIQEAQDIYFYIVYIYDRDKYSKTEEQIIEI